MATVIEHPDVRALREATAQLTAPGAAFELHIEDVLGVDLPVFRRRPPTLGHILAGAASHGDRDCMVFDDGTRIGYADVEARAIAVATWLRDLHGVGRGDRVAICGANSPQWLLTFWGCAALGAVVVAMNGWWTGVEMAHALDLSEPTLVLMDARRRSRLEPGGAPGRPPIVPLESVPVDVPAGGPDDGAGTGGDVSNRGEPPGSGEPTGLGEPIDPTASGVGEDDPFMLLFTSGTTGRPKAATLSHRNIVAYCMLQAFLGARGALVAGRGAPDGPPPSRLAVFPLFHVSGLGVAVTTLLTGAATVWPLGRFDPGHVIELTRRTGLAVWNGAATHIHRLLDHPDIETLDPAQIVQVGIGGSASTPELIRRTEARFPHLKGTFSSGYGSTESCGLISFATNALLRAAPDCVGPPLPGVEVAIVGDDGRPVPDGVIGNICGRSALVMLGYWRHDEANAETLLPGRWLRTGDFGRLEGGCLYLASRRRDLIIRGGENIYPFEIENRIEEHPDVVEVAVLGADHPVLGQEVRAIVVTRPGASVSEDGIRVFCAGVLASYKVPAVVELWSEPLPRNPAGKVMKHVLAGEGEGSFVPE